VVAESIVAQPIVFGAESAIEAVTASWDNGEAIAKVPLQ
jgi:hypothetical protein